VSDRLTLAEIEAQFVSEWVLIEDPQTNNALEVQGGKILYHSKDRDEHAGAVIGGINLRLHFDHHVGEMGYSIARSSWRRG
jgi:predicted acetyltransferase